MALVHQNVLPPNVLSFDSQPDSDLKTAKMLYKAQHFRESANILKEVCKRDPSNRLAKQELSKTISRLPEQQKGLYNFRDVYAEAARLRPPCLDRATYVGKVEVLDVVGMGRGVFTTMAAKAGDLLVCEKAFAYSYTDGGGGQEGGNSADLRKKIMLRLEIELHSLVDFAEIWHGDVVPAVGVRGELVVDPILVDRVISLNAFTGSLSTLSSHLSSSASLSSSRSSGLWPLAARTNHSCLSNCRRSFIGDMLIIRAAQDIPSNTELLWSYRIPEAQDHDYATTQEGLKGYGFVCACPLCLDARNFREEMKARRVELRGELKSAFASGRVDGEFNCMRVDTKRIERSLSKLEETYAVPADMVPRTGLWDPYLALTRIYTILDKPERVIRSTLKTLEMLGFVITGADAHPNNNDSSNIEIVKWGLVVDYLVEFWLVLWTAYARLEGNRKGGMEKGKKRADMARKWAVVSYRIVVGEDETFEETYGEKARVFIGRGELWRSG